MKAKLMLLSIVVVAAGCDVFRWISNRASEPPPEVTQFEETYLPFKQPNRGPEDPAMWVVRDDGDDKYADLDASDTYRPHGEEYQWGMRTRVRVTTSTNQLTRHTGRSVQEVIEETPSLDGRFRVRALLGAHFGDDRRSFVDGKSFGCSNPEVCAALDERIGSDERFDITAKFGPTVDAPLIIESVESATCNGGDDCSRPDVCCALDTSQCVVAGDCPDGKRVF